MQERTFYKGWPSSALARRWDVEPECDAGHPHTVLIGRDAAVLDEFLHLQRIRVIGNPFQKNVHPDFFFRGQFADHSNSSTRAAVSSRGAVPSTTRIGQHSASAMYRAGPHIAKRPNRFQTYRPYFTSRQTVSTCCSLVLTNNAPLSPS